MALKFTTTGEVAGCVKALVYGEAGAGKTVLCGTLPDNVIISAENGLLSLADKNIPVIEIASADDCFEALAFIQNSHEAKQFKTVSLDSISDIAEVMLADYKKQYKDPRQAYGMLADDMGDLVRSFRDLFDRNVYFTAKMVAVLDEYSGLMKYLPSMPGKSLTNALPFFFDEVLALRIYADENGENWRYLQTAMDMQYTAKDRSGKLLSKEKPHLGELFDKILNTTKTDNGELTPDTSERGPEIEARVAVTPVSTNSAKQVIEQKIEIKTEKGI